jgi:hypothetical protein
MYFFVVNYTVLVYLLVIMENKLFYIFTRFFGVCLSPTMLYYSIHHFVYANYANAVLGVFMTIFAFWLLMYEE